jgi:drug/metabolite transporter (DMT)-like permease
MIWILAITLHLTSWITSQIIIKYLGNKGISKTKINPFLYLACFLIIATYDLFWGGLAFKPEYLLIMLVALFNPFGNLFRIVAYGHSLSKTNLVSPLSGVIVVSLAALFLGENKIYNAQTFIGVALMFLALFLLSLKRGKEKEEKVDFKWLVFVSGMVLVEGGVIFMQKYFSFNVPRHIFFFFWYSASVFSAFMVFIVKNKVRPEKTIIFNVKEILSILLAGVFLFGSTINVYWAFQLAPAGLVDPTRRFGMTLLSILSGWFIFKERKELTEKQIIGFIVGVIAASLIFISIY